MSMFELVVLTDKNMFIVEGKISARTPSELDVQVSSMMDVVLEFNVKVGVTVLEMDNDDDAVVLRTGKDDDVVVLMGKFNDTVVMVTAKGDGGVTIAFS